MSESPRLRRWLRSLEWPALIAVIIAVAAALFAFNVAWWWIAHHLSWWTYAAMATTATFGWQTVTSTVSVVRKLRRKPHPATRHAQ